jgi:hypothetical protein
MFQGRVLEDYDRLVDEFGLEVIDAVGSITDQQRAFRRLVTKHLAGAAEMEIDAAEAVEATEAGR